MKHRVMEFERGNGERFYRLDYKSLGLWRSWYKSTRCSDGGYLSELLQFGSKQDAEDYVLAFEERVQAQKEREVIGKRVV